MKRDIHSAALRATATSSSFPLRLHQPVKFHCCWRRKSLVVSVGLMRRTNGLGCSPPPGTTRPKIGEPRRDKQIKTPDATNGGSCPAAPVRLGVC